MDLGTLLDRRGVQQQERSSLEEAVRGFVGEPAVQDVHRIIYREDGSELTDFDIVTRDGTVIEAFTGKKRPSEYTEQLGRIAEAVRLEQSRGRQYSGNVYVFLREGFVPVRLERAAAEVSDAYGLRVNIVCPQALEQWRRRGVTRGLWD